MAKLDGDQEELTERDAALVKGMLARGDHQHHIAAWFGVDSRAISHVNKGKTFPSTQPADAITLPPPGPYRPDPSYVRLYQTMARVNQLWEARRLKDAKSLLEAALESPAISRAQTELDQAADDLLRDEFGIISI